MLNNTHPYRKGMSMRLGKYVLLVLAMVALIGGCTRGTVKKAVTDSAKEYVVEMGYGEFIGSSSTGTDADGDGYVSIDVRVKNSAGAEETINLECTYSYVGFTTGCKEKVIINKSK
jgi:hypothetical protein